MPIYLYECDSCGVRFERLESMSSEPLAACPECEEGHVHRVIQPVGIIFKGSGFYITDNRQVSSPTLAPTKELDKPQETKESKGEKPRTDKKTVTEKPRAEKKPAKEKAD